MSSISSRSATTLVQRGYDNVFMLSGGLKVAELKFPSVGLIANGRGSLSSELPEDVVVNLDEALEEALEIEPHINIHKAIKVPQTGIIHYADVGKCRSKR